MPSIGTMPSVTLALDARPTERPTGCGSIPVPQTRQRQMRQTEPPHIFSTPLPPSHYPPVANNHARLTFLKAHVHHCAISMDNSLLNPVVCPFQSTDNQRVSISLPSKPRLARQPTKSSCDEYFSPIPLLLHHFFGSIDPELSSRAGRVDRTRFPHGRRPGHALL